MSGLKSTGVVPVDVEAWEVRTKKYKEDNRANQPEYIFLKRIGEID